MAGGVAEAEVPARDGGAAGGGDAEDRRALAAAEAADAGQGVAVHVQGAVALHDAHRAGGARHRLALVDPAVDEERRPLPLAPPLGQLLLGALAVHLNEVDGPVEEGEGVAVGDRALGVRHRRVGDVVAAGGVAIGQLGRQVGEREVDAAADERAAPPGVEPPAHPPPDDGGHGAEDDGEAVGVADDLAALGAVEEGGEARLGVALHPAAAQPVPLDHRGRDEPRRLHRRRHRLERRPLGERRDVGRPLQQAALGRSEARVHPGGPRSGSGWAGRPARFTRRGGGASGDVVTASLPSSRP